MVVMTVVPAGRADAQIIDAIEDVIKAALMAVDLGIQKVQTETVNLQDVEKALENAMAADPVGRYNELGTAAKGPVLGVLQGAPSSQKCAHGL